MTAGLVVLNVLVYWYEFTLGDVRFEAFLDDWGMVPRHLVGFLNGASPHPGVLVTPLTAMYLHVGVVHLATNMLYLWVFGSAVEEHLGRQRFLLFYTACGVIGGLVQVAASHDSPIPAVGASGAIAGLLAAYLLLRPGATIAAVAPGLFFSPRVETAPALMLGLWLVSQLASVLVSLTAGAAAAALAVLAHLGGFGAGLVLTPFFRPRRNRSYH